MKTKIILLAAVAALSASCSQEFLTSEPVLAQSPSEYYSTDEQMLSALVAAYDPLNYCSLEPMSYFVPYSEIRSDNANTGLGADSEKTDLRNLELYKSNISTVNETAELSWDYNYRGVYRCNLLINADYSSTVADVYKAEAHFLRAWYLFQLQRMYGPCVIPLDTAYALEEKFVRSTREEVNAQIEADLEIAIAGCDDKAAMDGRINKSAARALLAKHYLYSADWDNDNATTFSAAIPLLESVISSGYYQLCSYNELFNYEFKNNKECIFEIQTITTASGTNSSDSPWALDAGMWAKWCGLRQVKNHPLFHGEVMWGGMFLTKDLYDYYIDGDVNRQYETFITQAQIQLEGEVGYDGVNPVTWSLANSNVLDWEGYDQRKFTTYWDTPYTGTMAQNKNFANVMLIRYSDVYLMLAEAYLRGDGNESKAKELINIVRAAHEPDAKYPTVDEMMAAFPSRFPTVLDVLWYERRVEFAGEGDRTFDLVRTGRVKDVMTQFLASGRMYNNQTVTWDNTMNYLPVCYDETSVCPTLTSYPDEVNDSSIYDYVIDATINR